MISQDPSRVKWIKSSHSGADDNCVEIADLGAKIGIRDSKNPNGGYIEIDREHFRAFLASLLPLPLPPEGC